MANFKVGKKAVCIKNSFALSKTWQQPYPVRGKDYVILSIRKHPIYDFLLFIVEGFKQELCERLFRPLDENFAEEAISNVEKEINAKPHETEKEIAKRMMEELINNCK